MNYFGCSHLDLLLTKIVEFGTDVNPREPIDRGTTDLEGALNNIYGALDQYRAHEVNEIYIFCFSLTTMN